MSKKDGYEVEVVSFVQGQPHVEKVPAVNWFAALKIFHCASGRARIVQRFGDWSWVPAIKNEQGERVK